MEMMDREKSREAERKPGSVKAAVKRITEGNPTANKFQTTYPEVSTFNLRVNVHFQLTESRKIAELVTAEAASELSDSEILLESVQKELEATKQELAQIKDESFQLMASMDVVRDQLRHVIDQTARAKKEEQKTEMTIQNLNSKLTRSKTKLEAKSAAEDRANSIVSNFEVTLEQLELEAETNMKEQYLLREKTEILKEEVQKAETEIDLAEEKLQAALEDLKAVKSSESVALENLKGNAAEAKEIADMTVAAAQAWIEALKASEKEIQIKAKLLQRETSEQQVEEEDGVHQTEGSTIANKIVENDFEKWRQMMEPENLPLDIALQNKAMNRSIKRQPTRRGTARRSGSPNVHSTPRSSSFTVRRRRKMIPNLAKFFTGKIGERDLEPI